MAKRKQQKSSIRRQTLYFNSGKSGHMKWFCGDSVIINEPIWTWYKSLKNGRLPKEAFVESLELGAQSNITMDVICELRPS